MNDNDQKMLSQDLHELHDVISSIKEYQRKQSSLTWNFWRGVIYGFGFFIGSALLAAALIYILTKVGNDSFFGRFIQNIVNIVEKKR